MSLGGKIQRFEKSVKCYGLWKRTSSPCDASTIRDNILQYMDETTKPGERPGREKMGLLAGKLGATEFLIQGVDYLTKEPQGRLKIYGFLLDDVTRLTGRFPIHLTNNERVTAASEAWMQRLSKKDIKRVGHKYVLSLDPKLCEILAETGKSADEVLTQAVRRIMRRYQEKYYPNDRVGYLVGVHHDRKHIHAHVMLFPTTERGKLLRVTDESKEREGRTMFTDMRLDADKLIRGFYEREIKHPIRASNRAVPEIFQERLLARAALINYERAKMTGSDAEKWFWVSQEKKRLGAQDDASLRQTLREVYAAEEARYGAMVTAVAGPKGEATKKKLAETLAKSTATIQEDMSALFTQLKGLNNERRTLQVQRRTMKTDLGGWQTFKTKTLRQFTGSFTPADDKTGWLLAKFRESGPLKDYIAAWIDQQQKNKNSKAQLKTMLDPFNPEKVFGRWGKTALEATGFMESHQVMDDKQRKALEKFLKGMAKLQGGATEDFVKEFMRAELKARDKELKEMDDRKREILRKLQAVRTRMQLVGLDNTLVASLEEERKPSYLQRYEGWKLLGTEIPLSRPKGQDMIDAELPNRADDTADDLNTRIAHTLELLRGQRNERALTELQTVFRPSQYQASRQVVRTPVILVDEAKIQRQSDNFQKFLAPRRDGLQRQPSNNELAPEDREKQVIKHSQSSTASAFER